MKTGGALEREHSISNIPLKSIEYDGEPREDEAEDDNDDDTNDRGDAAGDDSDYVKSESESDVEIHRFNRKRSLDSAFSQASANLEHRAQPRKRIRRALNPRYVDLLNDDIEDIRRRYVPDALPQLKATQFGLTVWEEEEKELLYEAISRLGRDDVQGIVKRLSTKSEIEVRHYLYALRKDTDERRGRLRDPLLPLPLSEFPAAVEIGNKCCAALDVEADLVVQREARDEAKNEERAWGPHWLVNGVNCGHLSKAALASAGVAADDDASNRSISPMPGTEAISSESIIAQMQSDMRPEAVPALSLLNTPNMLLLSERVFMNGVSKEDNYLGLGSELPAVQTSALKDMYEIVFSLTQRLVATAIHMSQSRDRAQQAESFKRLNKNVVHVSDVHAAISTLGLKRDMQEFWARCPRRLGLHVSRSAGAFSNMHIISAKYRGGDEIYDEDDDAMTYSEAEHELEPEPTPTPVGLGATAALQTEALKDVQEDDNDSNSADDNDSNIDRDDTEGRISLEAEEILTHSATGFPNVNWARQILRNRIGDELKEEAHANAIDRHQNNADELYLWKVVGKKPPPSTGLRHFDANRPPAAEGFSATAKRFPVNQIIDTGRNWRAKLQYEAEWEDAAAEVQRLVDEAEHHDMAG